MDSDIASVPAKPRRRWLRFSLRTLLLVVTVLCVWLAIKVNAAHRQAKIVAAIQRSGGAVAFDYQLIPAKPGGGTQFDIDWDRLPPTPGWLRYLFGDDWFRTPIGVTITLNPATRSQIKIVLEQWSTLDALRSFEIQSMSEDDDQLKAVGAFLESIKAAKKLDRVSIGIEGCMPLILPDGEFVSFEKWISRRSPLQDLRHALGDLHAIFPNAEISCFYEANDQRGFLY